MLAQSGSPQGREIIGRMRAGKAMELQKGGEYLAILAPKARKPWRRFMPPAATLVEGSILRSHMIGDDKERLFAAAKSERSVLR